MASTVFENEYDFGHIRIIDEETDEGTIRTLLLNGVKESACYVDEGRHFDLRFAYNHEFVRILNETDDDRRVLLIGGAGFSLPKYFISSYDTGIMDVVELHRPMYDIAKKYFFLDELYTEYKPGRTGRLNVYSGDGSEYIKRQSMAVRGLSGFPADEGKTYDVVLDDAFIGMVHDDNMLSNDTIDSICDILNEHGIFAINMITPLLGYGSMQLILTKSILGKHFKTVMLWQVNPERKPQDSQNCILYARDPIKRYGRNKVS